MAELTLLRVSCPIRGVGELRTFCHEADLVHKIQEQMDKKRDMLIANLSAMY